MLTQSKRRVYGALALIATISAGSFFYASSVDDRETVKVSSEAASPWSRVGREDPQALPTLPKNEVQQAVFTLPVNETRTQKIDKLLESTNPQERLAGVKDVMACVSAQRNFPEIAKSLPTQNAEMYGAIQKACDGVTNVQMSKRFTIIQELARSKIKGASELYISETQDGTPLNLARRDANYDAWFKEALGLLGESANTGDRSAQQTMAGILYQEPGRYQDFLRYKVALLENSRLKYPGDRAQLEGTMAYLVKESEKHLSREQIEESVSAGKSLGQTTFNGEKKQ